MNQIKTVVNKLFTRYLLVTNTLTCGGLLAVGDVVTQRIEWLDVEDEGKKKHNWGRTGTIIIKKPGVKIGVHNCKLIFLVLNQTYKS